MAENLGALCNRVSVCVEGNISAGKTTFLERIIRESLASAVQVVPEPIGDWVALAAAKPLGGKLGGGGGGDDGGVHNILGRYYEDSERWSFTFQNWVFFTRQRQEAASRLAQSADIRQELRLPEYRLLERSVFRRGPALGGAGRPALCSRPGPRLAGGPPAPCWPRL